MLDVFYKNRHVGTLAEMADKKIAFQYDRERILDLQNTDEQGED
jgi:hypothetical protein